MTRKAIVFDMDGLMVDTEPLSHQAWDELLRPFGHKLSPELIHQIIGHRADVSTQIVRDWFALPMDVPTLIRQRAAIYAAIRARGVPPMPGLFDLHARIAAQQLPWAVATSSPRAHAAEILAQLDLTPTRSAIACGDEVAHGKPAPDIYLLAAERLGIPPTACIALEDSGPGSKAAVAAGMLTIAIPNAHTKTADFSHADYVFRSLHDVIDHLPTLLSA